MSHLSRVSSKLADNITPSRVGTPGSDSGASSDLSRSSSALRSRVDELTFQIREFSVGEKSVPVELLSERADKLLFEEQRLRSSPSPADFGRRSPGSLVSKMDPKAFFKKKSSSLSVTLHPEVICHRADRFLDDEQFREQLNGVQLATGFLKIPTYRGSSTGFEEEDSPRQSELPEDTKDLVEACLAGENPISFEDPKLLAVGGQGTVRKAELLGRIPCVIKKTHGQQELFAREYDIVRLFKGDPRFVQIHAVKDEKEIFYHYVAGGDLSKFWKMENPQNRLTSKHLTKIIKQIADAMRDVHHRGIVHRDLKPANIFLNESGDVIIGDFGLADRVESVTQERYKQADMGTTVYIAFEAYVTGCVTIENCTKRDVWALGMMLWCLFSKGDRAHPCTKPYSTSEKEGLARDPLSSMSVCSGMCKIAALGGFTAGELESQLDPEKLNHYDPHRHILRIMEECLVFDPNQRISMEGIVRFLETLQMEEVSQCELMPNLTEI
jgi:predicted Ser/Thr protein kinase